MRGLVVIAAVSGCLCCAASSAGAQQLNRRLFPSDAVYQLHLADPAFRNCDTNRDGAFEPEELACYNAQPKTVSYVPPPPVRLPVAVFEAAVQAVPKEARTEETVPASDPLKASNSVRLLIRRSTNDIGSFADPTPFADASGAEFAWASDRIADNDVWSAHGIVAVPFVHHGEVQRDEPYIDTLTLAPYVNFDRVSNSKKTDEDVDNLTYGGVLELGYANVWAATQYLRASGDVVSSFDGDSKNWSAAFTWQPIGGVNPEGGNTIFSYMGTPLRFGRNFVLTVSPKVDLDYANDLSNASQQPIFADHDEALRTGPTVTLALDGKKGFDYVPWWIQRIHYEISYGWLYDLLSSRQYELLDTALSFSLDEAGHLGLTLSYRNGDLIETGQKVDLANIALSVSY